MSGEALPALSLHRPVGEVEHSARLEELEQALARAEQRLLQTHKLATIGQLAHGIAHELNTPLGAIISNLAVLVGYGDALAGLAVLSRETANELRRQWPENTAVEALESGLRSADLDYILADIPPLTTESSASANRIANLVRSVSIFAQDATGVMDSVSIEEVLEVGLTLALTEIKHRVRVHRAFAGVPAVLGNASELMQVVVHVLLNAAQAMDERGGRVWVTTAFDNGEVTVCIADEGRGIPADSLARVFEPFFSTRAPGEGTGLGLTVCQGIMARHAGTIGIQTVPGAGTRVTLRLPPYAADTSRSPFSRGAVEVAR